MTFTLFILPSECNFDKNIDDLVKNWEINVWCHRSCHFMYKGLVLSCLAFDMMIVDGNITCTSTEICALLVPVLSFFLAHLLVSRLNLIFISSCQDWDYGSVIRCGSILMIIVLVHVVALYVHTRKKSY